MDPVVSLRRPLPHDAPLNDKWQTLHERKLDEIVPSERRPMHRHRE